MSGGLLEVTGWPLAVAAKRAALHVEIVLAEGGFAQAVTLPDRRVAWIGPFGLWRHAPDGYRLKQAEIARARREAEEEAKAARRRQADATRVVNAAKARAAQKVKRERLARERASGVRGPGRLFGPIPNTRQTKRALTIMAEVAERHGLKVEVLISPQRTKPVYTARAEAMWLIRELRNQEGERLFNLERIGRLFRRDHASVCVAIQRYAARAGATFDGETLAIHDEAWRPAA